MFCFKKIKDFLLFFKIKKWPSKNQWKNFFKVLSKKEKIVFFILFIIFLSSSSFILITFYFEKTKIVPAEGGIFIEGVVGQPRWIQPIYAPLNDIDRDLVELIYSGLMKYNSEGKIMPDLIKDYKILEDGRVYEFYLKENLFWQDGKPLTVDDIIFTINIIQNPDYKSPLRISWFGIKTEKISENVVRFELKNPYTSFLENATIKILPKHIWENISPESFPLTIYNLKPIGSGPFKLKEIKRDSSGKIISLDLVRNQYYSGKFPYLAQISFRFFETEEDLIKSAIKGEIKGFSLVSVENFPNDLNKNWIKYSITLPRYFSLFLNSQKLKILGEKEIREALNYGINKNEILKNVLFNQGDIINSPLLPEIFNLKTPAKTYEFNLEKANEILDKTGFLKDDTGIRKKVIKKVIAFQFKNNLQVGSKGKEVEELQKCLAQFPEIYPDGEITGNFGQKTKEAVINFQKIYLPELKATGLVGKKTREKLNEICFKSKEEEIFLKFSLTTINQAMLVKTATLLKEMWEKIGVEIEIKTVDLPILEREIIKPRNYEILLFGEILGSIPDPFPFWHSSQKNDPGLNLALYENKNVDKLLEKARETLNDEERKRILEEIQNILIEDVAAIFLYNPNYLYFTSKEIKGIDVKIITDTSKRFSNIENWYIKTKRVW